MPTTIQPRMIRMRQVTEYTALSRAYIYQKISEGSFPKGRKVSIGVTAWERSLRIVMFPPLFDDDLCLLQRVENFTI